MAAKFCTVLSPTFTVTSTRRLACLNTPSMTYIPVGTDEVMPEVLVRVAENSGPRIVNRRATGSEFTSRVPMARSNSICPSSCCPYPTNRLVENDLVFGCVMVSVCQPMGMRCPLLALMPSIVVDASYPSCFPAKVGSKDMRVFALNRSCVR